MGAINSLLIIPDVRGGKAAVLRSSLVGDVTRFKDTTMTEVVMMRAARVFGLCAALSMGCGEPTSFDDPTEGDSVPSDGSVDDTNNSDVPSDTPSGPVVWSTVEPALPIQVLNHPAAGLVYWAAPEDAAGVVFVFHGTGGDATLVESTETMAIMNEIVDAGLAYIAFDAANAADKRFNATSAPNSNADWSNLRQVRESLVVSGAITEVMPTFFWGYSAGGSFASWAGHAALDAGWNLRGLIFQQSTGRSQFYGDAPDVDVLMALTENDEKIDVETARENYEEHAAQNDDVLVDILELDLDPTRFARTPFFDETQSAQVFSEAVRAGLYDEQGVRQFDLAGLPDVITDFVNTYDVIYPKPAKAQLNVVLATHAVNGKSAEQTGAFVESRL